MTDRRSDDEAMVLGQVAALCQDLHHGEDWSVGLDSDLSGALGIDSLAMVELVERIQEAAGVPLGDDVIDQARTPRELVRAVEAARGRPRRPERRPVVRRLSATGPVPPPGGVTSFESERFATLAAALTHHGVTRPDQVTVRLLGTDSGGQEEEEITYGELLGEAREIGRALVGRGLSHGERVALMLPTGRQYFSAFCGILLAGGVPVPLYPPTGRTGLAEQLIRLAGLLRNAGAVVMVTVPEAVTAARILTAEVPTLRTVRTVDELRRRSRPEDPLPEVHGDDLALIQYTSGSTGDPKGVVLTHAQTLANGDAMARAAELRLDDVVVSWLPLYHDMGLIGVWLTPLVAGVPLVVMTPRAFLARPVRWLEAITRYGGTISAAPNFAYQACADRIADADLQGLDLSTWRLAFNGSEPVTVAAIDAFVGRFGRFGFRREAMCPAYGLAEAGVGVAFSPLGRGPRVDAVSREALASSGRALPVPPADPGAHAVVGCGRPLPGYEIRVESPAGDVLPDRREGRVVCRGPSLTTGYFANEPATRALWNGGWLDTGDLGYLADGELFLTGRSKDLIIRGGRNVHPEDVEAALAEVHGLHPDGVAVFAAADPRHGTERLVVAAETDARSSGAREELTAAIRRRAVDAVELAPDDVVLVPVGSIRRTRNGKIERGATRIAYERGELSKSTRPLGSQLAVLGRSLGSHTAGRIGRMAGRWAFAAYAWLATVLVAGPLSLAVRLPMPLPARWRLVRRATRALSWMTGIGVTIDGSLPPPEVPVVVVANHPSFVDAAALVLASADPLTFVTSTDFEQKPLVGPFLRRIGCVFVTRDAPSRSSADVAALAELVGDGHRLAVFPEGSIARAVGVRHFHLGAFAVAAATGCAVVPVGIRGTRQVVPPGSYLPRRGRVSVRVGAPVGPPGSTFATEAAVAGEVRRSLAQASGEPLVETVG